ncbi:MAG: hypothetical protein V3W28_03410 [Thermoplasmata archaeon]
MRSTITHTRRQAYPLWRPASLAVPALLGLLFAISSFGPTAEAQFAWNIEVIEWGVSATGRVSLALDADGRPHVAYVDTGQGALVYARWNGSEWISEILVQTGFPLGMVNLVLDDRSFPHFTYFDADSSEIRYLHFTGFSWRNLRVDNSRPEGHSSLVLDEEGTPHVAYSWGNGDLRLARLEGASWVRETVDRDVVAARYPSLAFDSSGRPQIAYYRNGQLYHALWIGYKWTLSVVDTEQSPRFVSLAVDSDDTPKIGYQNSIARELRYASWNGTAWTREVAGAEGDIGWDAYMTLDEDGDPHISHYDKGLGALLYTLRTGGAWQTYVVERDTVTGWWSSLAIGADQRPHFAYYSWADRAIKYAFAEFAMAVRTLAARQVTWDSAVLVGEVTSVGTAAEAQLFFEFRPEGGEWERLDVALVLTPGIHTLELGDLESAMTYEFRAVMAADEAQVSGEIRSFTTAVAPIPQVLSPELVLVIIFVVPIVLALLAYFVVRRRGPVSPETGPDSSRAPRKRRNA